MKLEEWKRHRKWTLANCCVGAFSFGLSLTIYYPTEYYYFRDTMKIKNADIYYGLSWAFLCGAGIISSFVGSYYADMTKNMREICLFTNLINVVGNIMYLLYYSPYVVLFGQFLIGTAAARMVAGVGEISRIYGTEELTQKVAFMGIFSTIGSILGPCTTFLFNMVDTKIGNWRLNIGNMVGLFMGGLYLFQFIINFFTLKNLSKEYNLKKEASEKLLKGPESEYEDSELSADEGSREKDVCEEIVNEKTFQEKYIIAIRTLLKNKQVLFLYGLSFFASYSRATIILLSPIKAAEYLKWSQTNLATFNIVSTFAGAIPTALTLSALSKVVNDFYFLVYTVATLLLALIFMALFPMVADNHVMATVLLYANGILTLMSTAGFHIMSRSMLAKFVPENIQTVTEAIRNSLFELSYMIAGLCVKLPATYMPEFMISVAFFTTFALAWLLVNDEKYKNIEIIRIEPDK